MSKERVLADPNVAIESLEKVITGALQTYGKPDLQAMMLECGDQREWRSNIDVEKLLPMCGLISKALDVCPNGVLPTSKLRTAIGNANQKKKCNWTSMGDEEFSDKYGYPTQPHHIVFHFRISHCACNKNTRLYQPCISHKVHTGITFNNKLIYTHYVV